jgi:hypothetical protein
VNLDFSTIATLPARHLAMVKDGVRGIWNLNEFYVNAIVLSSLRTFSI